MKGLFIAFILIATHSLSTYAGEKIITLTKKYVEDKLIWGEDARSITPAPIVINEGKMISIYSDTSFENIKVTIKDYDNHIVHSSFITTSINYKTSIILNITERDYLIELTYKQIIFWGIIELR